MFWTILLLIVNFFISWGNAYCCGRYWSESKALGGFFRLNVIVGYIMAIAGFTMVYGYVLLLVLPYILPLITELTETQMAEIIQLSADLIYLLVAFTVIPTGFIIWFNSLATFWRHKTISNGLTAGYNTFAQLHNVINASREVPSAFSRVTSALFGDKGKKKKSDEAIAMGAILVVILAIFGGYFTASSIMKKADREFDAFSQRN